MLFAVGDHAGVDNALPMVRGITAGVEMDVSASEVYTDLLGDLLQGFQPLGQQDHVRLMDGSNGEGGQHRAMVVGHGDDLLPLLVLLPRIAHAIAPLLATVLVPSPWRI